MLTNTCTTDVIVLSIVLCNLSFFKILEIQLQFPHSDNWFDLFPALIPFPVSLPNISYQFFFYLQVKLLVLKHLALVCLWRILTKMIISNQCLDSPISEYMYSRLCLLCTKEKAEQWYQGRGKAESSNSGLARLGVFSQRRFSFRPLCQPPTWHQFTLILCSSLSQSPKSFQYSIALFWKLNIVFCSQAEGFLTGLVILTSHLNFAHEPGSSLLCFLKAGVKQWAVLQV